MDNSLLKYLVFNIDRFDDWRVRMQAHLEAADDDMWDIIEKGPFVPMMHNPAHINDATAPAMIEKPKADWDEVDRKRNRLEKLAKDTLFKCVTDQIFPRVRRCTTAKQIWDTLILLG